MEPIVLVKIKSLHAQSSGNRTENSLRQERNRHGPSVACLDDSAAVPANTGMIDLAAGTIRLQWAVIATLPFTGRCLRQRRHLAKDSASVRATLDESGQILDDGSGFRCKGHGTNRPRVCPQCGKHSHASKRRPRIRPESAVWSTSTLLLPPAIPYGALLCPSLPFLQVKLPKSLGGGTQRLNLMGGFVLVPLMTLERPDRTKRSRR